MVLRVRHRHDRTVADNRSTLLAVQELNGRFTIGTVGLWRDPTRVFYQLSLPLRYIDIDAQLVTWLLARAQGTAAVLEDALHRRTIITP